MKEPQQEVSKFLLGFTLSTSNHSVFVIHLSGNSSLCMQHSLPFPKNPNAYRDIRLSVTE